MTSSVKESSPRNAGVIAGLGYVGIFILAIFANFLVKEGMVIPGDAAASAENILNAPGLFRGGIVSFLVVFLLDVPIAWALYVLLRPVHRDHALLSAWFRLVYTVFLGVALVYYFQALLLLEGSSYTAAFDPDQLQATAMIALESFNFIWLVGLTAFGVHLIVTGSILVRSTAVPRILGWILMVSGTAYIADTIARIVLADYASVAGVFLIIVMIPSILAEGWFGLWLLIKGGRKPLV